MESNTTLSSHLGKGEESYPDLLALVIAVIVTIIVAMGVKNSVGLNNVLNVINLAVWVFIMIAGLFYIKSDNWAEGQFLPFGWPGVSPGSTEGHTAPKCCHTLSFAHGVHTQFRCTFLIPALNSPMLCPGTSKSQECRLGSRPALSTKPKEHGNALSLSPNSSQHKPRTFPKCPSAEPNSI